jgi:methylenetetrahydrofolate dehydrogenase (NADP+)/methenyltetrahydrofolate cyclohydrolase
MILLDGKALSKKLFNQMADSIRESKISPGLTVILVGDDPASHVYVRNKDLGCQKVGIRSDVIRLPDTVSKEKLVSAIEQLNNDPKVNGILIQLPLPNHLDTEEILSHVSEQKDVDGFNVANAGKLFRGLPGLVPCTPKGVIRLLDEYDVPIKGKNAVVLGRSNIVGKPIAHLLLNRDATVTSCHRDTQNIEKICQQADIIVSAVGKLDLVKANWVKQGACVVDVGINRKPDGTLAGDVAFDEVSKKAAWITPVPGGVGPMTIAMLLENTIEAFETQQKL